MRIKPLLLHFPKFGGGVIFQFGCTMLNQDLQRDVPFGHGFENLANQVHLWGIPGLRLTRRLLGENCKET
ncbi:MAG: hypothetical protein CM15mP8_1050 [Methanobacteriota archaeon]|nr:MAG: hypothetical protein CM15mP8_1050 [Euryarchaeota archaeon]